ncbi:NAD(P)-dependent oxidoreductase [Natrarchaeobius halalkaliphilus]|uniref:NAD(P)-dependent oxidoreductase n=1 Tax=Natrarchaeobius halalkaliphilus TaxID=1679091 RepID=A0A3N6M3N2_9EURY|nr:SAF domain-containing protein [Natrarchaeobius halalkaliphilus]RQG86727.1 NAD(P)-dependent oxidoreductase [Natrarchaeobius halalkaliphilus]
MSTTSLYKELESLDEPLRLGIIGVGRMGQSISVTSERLRGIEIAAIADIDLERSWDTMHAMGHDEQAVRTVETVDEARNALKANGKIITTDSFILPKLDGLDVIICATGVPHIGAKIALRAITNEKHVVMLTDEADAVVGPYLSMLAKKTGVTYCGAAGDEPGAILELYNFVKSCGFEVVAAGKGKNNSLDRNATPKAVAEEAKEKKLNPEIYTAFVDGTNSMLEMTMVANATGLSVDKRGLHGPEVDDVQDLANVFSSTGEGGILSRNGVVDYALGGNVAPGVFVVVTTEDDTIQDDLEYLKLGTGPNYVFYRSYHIPTIEPLLSAARAELHGDANLVPQEPVVDTISVAKQNLASGDEIDGIGGETVYGLAENANTAAENDLVPISLIRGATLRRDVEQGEPIQYSDVELQDSELLHLRKLQDSYFEL